MEKKTIGEENNKSGVFLFLTAPKLFKIGRVTRYSVPVADGGIIGMNGGSVTRVRREELAPSVAPVQ